MESQKHIYFLRPRGMCAGVDRALNIIEKALEKYGAPIYVNHEIVHNKYVVEGFEKKGVIFCVSPDQVPKNSVYIFSAHGVSPKVQQSAKSHHLNIIDATCPLVEKVHTEAKFFQKKDFHILYIGHKNHPEAEGVMGIYPMTLIDSVDRAENIDLQNIYAEKTLTILTQTTLSIDETTEIVDILTRRFPKIIVPKIKDICYATQNRQDAVKEILPEVEGLLVVGSPNSSNSVRLVETANKNSLDKNFKAFLVPSAEEIPYEFLKKISRIGITSGASVPEELVQKIFSALQKKFSNITTEERTGKKETMVFRMPKI